MIRRALVGAVFVSLVAAGAALAGGVNGIWIGRFTVPRDVGQVPASAYPTAKLAVGPSWMTAQFSGKTIAAHDAETATSTCVMRFRFNAGLSADGWRVYQQVGKVVLAGSVSGGPPDNSACGDARSSHAVVRVRPAGSKLKAEFGERNGDGAAALFFGPGFPQAYLRH